MTRAGPRDPLRHGERNPCGATALRYGGRPMLSRCSLALLPSLLVSGGAAARGLSVRITEGSPCSSGQLVAALRARLPEAEVRGATGKAARTNEHDVTLSLTLSRGSWSMELLAPGQPPLARPIAVRERDCLALSEAAALITERYLESIHWTGAAGEVRPLPPPPRWRASVALGGGAAVGLTGVSPAVQLDIGARHAAWSLELSGAYLGGGSLDLRSTTQPAHEFHHSGAAGLSVGGRFELGPGALRAALTPGVALYWVGSSAAADTSPDPLPHRQLVLTPLPFLGAQAGYDVALTGDLSLGIRLQVRAHLGTRAFITEGYPVSLVTPPVTGDLTVVLGTLLF